MIRITDIHMPLDYTEEQLKSKICKSLRINGNALERLSVFRKSIDARKKNDIHFIFSVDAELNIDEKRALSKAKCKNAQITKPFEYITRDFGKNAAAPLVVGAGPAGLFAALILARSGAKPVLVERGRPVEQRVEDVERFWAEGRLNTESNVQFGEGGAGTFSDGKLNTGTKDLRARKVLLEFAKHGAPQEILYDAKPHIGTDRLRGTVKSIREEIVSLGGTVLFESKLTEILYKDSAVTGAVIEKKGSREIIETNNIILAVGHSARDTFEMLYNMGLPIEQKPFSVGARIEHLREKIDRSQYAAFAGHKALGAAPYKLSVHLKSGRGVYTFCMCPGGRVVAAASEEGRLVTNGMSDYARNGVNSNSALLVGITPEDFGSEHKLAGMYLQRELENKAFICGGENYNAPVQRVEDFLGNKKSTHFGEVLPSYRPGTEFCRMDSILPDFVCASMREAIPLLDDRLKGFGHGDALLTGVEARSSSPIRILRNENFESVSLKGLFPCGEGAGYAGGIVSAAVDGIRCAEKIIDKSNDNG